MPSIESSELTLASCHRCLANPARLRIVHALNFGPLSVTAIQTALSLPQVFVSKHLAYLHKHGILDRTRSGNMVFYSLTKNPSDQLSLVIDCLKKCAGGIETLQRDADAVRQLAPGTATTPTLPSRKEDQIRTSPTNLLESPTSRPDQWLFHGGDEYVD